MSSRIARGVISLVAAAAMLTLPLTPVVAVAGTASALPARPHCASLLSTPVHPWGRSRIVRTRCFGRLAPALRYAAKGAVVPDDITPDRIDDTLLASGARMAAADRTTIIGIHWEHVDRGGRDRIYYVKGSEPCGKGRAWQIDKLDKSWDSLVSSAEAFGGCSTFVQYARPRFKGVARTCDPYCDGLGPLNDRVGSIRWRA